MPIVLTADLFVAGDLIITGDDFDANGFDVTVTGNFDWSSSGTLLAGEGNWSIDGDSIISAGTTDAETSDWSIGGDVNLTGTAFTGDNANFVLNGSSGTQTVDLNDNTFWNLRVNASGATKQFTDGWTATNFQHQAGTFDINGQTVEATGYFYVYKNAGMIGVAGSDITVGGDLRIFGNASTLNPGSAWTISAAEATPRIGGANIANLNASGGTQIVCFNCTNSGSNTNLLFVSGEGTGGVILAGDAEERWFIVYRPVGGIELSSNLNPTLVDVLIYPTLDLSWSVPTVITVNKDFSWNVGSQELKWYRVEGKCVIPSCGKSGIKPPRIGTSAEDAEEIIEEIQSTPVPMPPYPSNPSFEDWSNLGGKDYPVNWFNAGINGDNKFIKDDVDVVHGEFSMKMEAINFAPAELHVAQTLDPGLMPPLAWLDFSFFAKTDVAITENVKPRLDINLYLMPEPQIGETERSAFILNQSKPIPYNCHFIFDFLHFPGTAITNPGCDHTYNTARIYLEQEWKQYSFRVFNGVDFPIQNLLLSFSMLVDDDYNINGGLPGFNDVQQIPIGKGFWLDAININPGPPPSGTAGSGTTAGSGCGTKFFTIVPAVSLADLCNRLSNPVLSPPLKGPLLSISRYSRPVRKDSTLAGDPDACNVLIEEDFFSIPECIEFVVDENIQESWGIRVSVKDTFIEVFPTGSPGIALGGTADAQIIPPDPPAPPSGGLVISGSATCAIIIGGIVTYQYEGQGGIIIGGDSEEFRSRASFVYSMSGGIILGGTSPSKRFATPYSYIAEGGLVTGGDAFEKFVLTHTPIFPFIFIDGSADAFIANYNTPGSGGVIIGGSSRVYATPRFYTGSGGITIGGDAIETANPWLYSTSGGLILGGYARIGREYDSSGGLILGGSADVRVKLRQVGSGTIIIGGEAGTVAAFYQYMPSGGIVIGGDAIERNSHLGLQDAGFGGAVFTELSLEPELGALPGGGELTITDAEATTECSGRDVPLVLGLSHNLEESRYFKTFLQRNNFTFPGRFNISFRDTGDSWRTNFHLTGLSEDNVSRESWNFVFEMSCTDEIAGDDLGQFVWKFCMFVRRKNMTTNQDFDTRLMFVIPADAAFSQQGRVQSGTPITRLDVTYLANTQTKFVATSGGIVSQPTIFHDGISMFTSKFWAKNPNLIISLSELTPVSRTPTFDVSPIFPQQPLLTV